MEFKYPLYKHRPTTSSGSMDSIQQIEDDECFVLVLAESHERGSRCRPIHRWGYTMGSTYRVVKAEQAESFMVVDGSVTVVASEAEVVPEDVTVEY